MSLKPGTWKAALADWGMMKAGTGTDGIITTYSVDCDGTLVQADKIFWLSDKAKNGTIERMYKLGFNGNIDDFAYGRSKEALTGGLEVRVVCAIEKDKEGNDVCRIQFVNLPDETHGLTKLEAKEGASVLSAYKADFLSMKPVTTGTVAGKKKGLNLA